MVVYEFVSSARELRYRLSLGQQQRRTDMAVNAMFGIVVGVATLKLQLHDGGATAWQLLSLWTLVVRTQCFAKCPFTCQFDWLSDQLSQSLDRLSDHFAKHWVYPFGAGHGGACDARI